MSRKPVKVVRPGKDFSKKKFAESMADEVVKAVNEQRKKDGLPPLPKD